MEHRGKAVGRVAMHRRGFTMRWASVCVVLCICAVVSALEQERTAVCSRDAAGTVPPSRPFHLESRPLKRWDVTFTRQHGPFRGVVYYAVPTDNPCQTIHSVELFAGTRKGRVE